MGENVKMKNSNTAFGTLALLVLVGCGGGTTKPKQDLGAPDLSGADHSVPVTCTTLATWPSTDVVFRGQANPIQMDTDIDFVTAAYERRPNAANSSLVDELRAEVWDATASPSTFPTSYPFNSMTTYGGCTGCVAISIGLDLNDPLGTPGTFYLAQAGTMNVTKADRDPASGQFIATGASLHLVEWSYYDAAGSDTAIAGGGCFDIGDFSVSGTYTNSLDGGTD
jgi:hypothetical protein